MEQFLDRMVVLCLSESWELVPMWSYYAESHKGFAIGFDSAHPFLSRIEPVDYTSPFPTLENDFAPVFQKSPQWRSEREWRVANHLDEDAPAETQGEIYLYEFPAEAISEVVLGHRIGECLKFQIKQVMRANDYSHVRLFQSVAIKGRWELNRQRESPAAQVQELA